MTVLLQDGFEYAVARDTVDDADKFVTLGPWAGAKSMQNTGQSGAHGYLYTATTIPGFSGSFPGTVGGSSRVLCMEALPFTENGQTDFYLDFGGSQDAIPADVWFQFWMYVNYSGTQLSHFSTRNKFLYPCDGDYPCNTGKWLIYYGAYNYNPDMSAPHGDPSAGIAFFNLRDAQVGTIDYSLADPGDESKLGQTDSSVHLTPNTWYLVKMHFDTGHTTGNSYEAWMKPQGDNFTKIADWIGGVTPYFTWSIPAENVGGHRNIRIPTTYPGNNVTDFYDSWVYMDDFVIATTEGDLPTYGGGLPSLSPSQSPSLSPSASVSPSRSPSLSPSASISPSRSPSQSPSFSPSRSPSESPSRSPSRSPSKSPSVSPSISPSISPSVSPSSGGEYARFIMSASPQFTDGSPTTAQLTAPTGKASGTHFLAGTIEEESPIVDSIDLGRGYGSELVTNGDMELDSDWTSVNSPETNERSNVQKHGGTYSRHIVDSTASWGGERNTAFTSVTGTSYRITGWYYNVSGTSRLVWLRGSDGNGMNIQALGGTGSWMSFDVDYTETIGGANASVAIINNSNVNPAEFYFDDISAKEIRNKYTEIEWCIQATSYAETGVTYEFRVTKGS